MATKVQSNAEFAEKDDLFKEQCSRASVSPTKRQASKWRAKRGAAWKMFKTNRVSNEG